MKKAIVTALLAGSMVCAAFAFTDVPDTHWAKSAIDSLTQSGVVAGYPDDTFRPDGTITRAEFYALFARTVMPEDIKDLALGESWWQPYLHALRSGNYNASYADETNATMNVPISRSEMAALVCNAGVSANRTNTAERTSPFHDVAETDVHHVSLAVYKGLLLGYEDGTFRGTQSLTRAEALTVIARILEQQSAQSKLVAQTGDVRVRALDQGAQYVLESYNVRTGDVLDMRTVSAQHLQEVDRAAAYGFDVLGYNSKYFWGTLGLFELEASGKITQISARPVIDYSYVADENAFIIITHPADDDTYTISLSAILSPFGNQIMKLHADGTETVLLGNNPPHGIQMIKVDATKNQVLFHGVCMEGQNSYAEADYLLREHKLTVLEVRGYYRNPSVQEEQAYLDGLQLNIGI